MQSNIIDIILACGELKIPMQYYILVRVGGVVSVPYLRGVSSLRTRYYEVVLLIILLTHEDCQIDLNKAHIMD